MLLTRVNGISDGVRRPALAPLLLFQPKFYTPALDDVSTRGFVGSMATVNCSASTSGALLSAVVVSVIVVCPLLLGSDTLVTTHTISYVYPGSSLALSIV
jgi:hypothetical protein